MLHKISEIREFFADQSEGTVFIFSWRTNKYRKIVKVGKAGYRKFGGHRVRQFDPSTWHPDTLRDFYTYNILRKVHFRDENLPPEQRSYYWSDAYS